MGSGIDYGMGQTNIDTNNGIRYGVISCNSLSEWFWESVEHNYGKPTCPKCGNEAKEGDGEETRWITTDEVSSFVDGPLGKELERTTLYWSNEDGWVEDEDSATIFTNEEKETFNLPMGEGYKVEWTVKEFTPHRERGCCGDYHCPSCLIYFDGDDAYPDEPLGWTIGEDGILAENCLDNDCCITKSPYYTYAPFCSPCVPGAGNLNDTHDNLPTFVRNAIIKHDECAGQFLGLQVFGVKTYCFDKSWFQDEECPYPYWSVETNELVYLPQRKEEPEMASTELIVPECSPPIPRKVANFLGSWISPSGAVQRLYQFDPPLKNYDDETIEFAVLSAVRVMGYPETYIFKANPGNPSAGWIVDWCELPGSQKDTLSHQQVLQDMGYEEVVMTIEVEMAGDKDQAIYGFAGETLNDEVVGDSSKVLIEEPPAEIIEEVTRAYRGENGIEIGGEG